MRYNPSGNPAIKFLTTEDCLACHNYPCFRINDIMLNQEDSEWDRYDATNCPDKSLPLGLTEDYKEVEQPEIKSLGQLEAETPLEEYLSKSVYDRYKEW